MPTRNVAATTKSDLLADISDGLDEAIWAVEAIGGASVSEVEMFLDDALGALKVVKERFEQLSNG